MSSVRNYVLREDLPLQRKTSLSLLLARLRTSNQRGRSQNNRSSLRQNSFSRRMSAQPSLDQVETSSNTLGQTANRNKIIFSHFLLLLLMEVESLEKRITFWNKPIRYIPLLRHPLIIS